MMKKIGFSQIAGCKRRHRAAAKAEKWNLPLVEKQRIWYNILHDAPSPSGKAGDFDSPTACSTHAGATEDRLLKETFGRRFLCLQLLPGRRNISQTEALCCGKTGHCGRAALGVCAVFRFEDARSYAGSWLGCPKNNEKNIVFFIRNLLFCRECLTRKCFLP